MEQIIRYVLSMLPYMLISLPAIIVWRVAAIFLMNRKGAKTTVLHEIGLLLFALFLVGLASQTVIPKLEFTQNGIGIVGGTLPASSRINLIPFRVFTEAFRDHYANYFLINFWGNIIMFVPIGFFIPLLWENVSIKRTLLIGFSASFFIETCQLLLARATDVDDLWLNTLGVLLGSLVYLMFQQMGPDLTAKFRAGGHRES